MRYFQRLGSGIDVGALRHQAQVQWDSIESDLDRLRRSQPQHAGVETRTLRGPWVQGLSHQGLATAVPCANYPGFASVSQARRLVFGLMAQVEGEQLGRVMLSRSAPGAEVLPHSDFVGEAAPMQSAIFYNRYHIVLDAGPGSVFYCGDEQVYMATGELWWFDNTQVHSVVNNSAQERLHLIVDIHTSTFGYEPKL